MLAVSAPIAAHTSTAPKMVVGDNEVILATVIFTVSLHVLMPLLTVAIYEVVAVGVTEMDWVVAVVDPR